MISSAQDAKLGRRRNLILRVPIEITLHSAHHEVRIRQRAAQLVEHPLRHGVPGLPIAVITTIGASETLMICRMAPTYCDSLPSAHWPAGVPRSLQHACAIASVSLASWLALYFQYSNGTTVMVNQVGGMLA